MGRGKEDRKMIKQLKMGLIALVGVAIWGFTPGVVHAAKTHTDSCNGCHRMVGANPRGMTNLCVNCHTALNPATAAKFVVGDASNAMGHGLNTAGNSSHNWGGFSSFKEDAGSTYPPTTFYFSKNSISTKRVTCSICHDPHLETSPNKLLRVAAAGDLICQQCHVNWFIPNLPDTNATLTHPLVADYATFAAANPLDYKAISNAGAGDVRLVDGGVSCTSCHATHYADSNSTTADGIANQGSLVPGDGHLLRSDGPLRIGATRNTPKGADNLPGTADDGAPGTAQLRSNLCQSCHTIELHGQGVSGDHMLGCLDCHGGHAYNGGTPNAYILNKMTPDAVPTRINGVNSAPAQITFANYPNGGSTRTKWADENVGGTSGFCERCHGDVNSIAMVTKAAEHGVGNTNECTACHKHNDPANLYSFNRDASAATCGQCHGFPPYKNVPGDRIAVPANDGGYALNNSSDPNTPYDYLNNSGHFKNEEQTGHKVHAGASLATSPVGSSAWYFVGVAGVDNCKVCHGPNAGSTAGGHREAPLTRPGTFRDVTFDAIAKTGGMSPVYSGAAPWTCSNVYCHTNGAPYTGGSRPTRNYSFVNVTPAWDQANGGGYGAIHGQTTPTHECSFCHGNTTTTMTSKSNSAAHQAHLGAATTLNMGKVLDCKICHVKTVSSPTALAAGAMDGRSGGEHVNGLINVDFETGSTPDTLPEALTGSTYTASTGVCSTYCHNVTGDAGAMAADWDVATDMQCDSCHGGLASDSSGNGGYGPITTGSHTRHTLTTGTGPKLACAECHGTNSGAGTHAGHLDGVVTMKPPVDGVTFATICEECHGYDAEAGEVLPVWGSPATTDCATCHAGTQCGIIFNGKSPKSLENARVSGHNRPTSAGAYTETANPAANLNCSDCHVTDDAGHWDGISGDDFLLKAGSGFPSTYAGSENSFCGNCHGASGSASKKDINTHQSKLCVACHNVHGDQNIQMIWTTAADQNSHDPSATGRFMADVFFTNVTNFLTGNLNSYDEDDGAVGSADEVNSDDLCATCHSSGAGTTHNNNNNTDSQAPTGHQMGKDCFTCHAAHTDSIDAFKLGAGTACNDCHGFPPATGAHRKGALITDPELHSNTTQNLSAEDRTDCAWCHTGADQYTYDLSLDQASGVPARANHGKGQTNRRTVLGIAVGYETTNFSCTNACHASSNGDGEWDDTTGLNCNACHYAAASPSSGGNVTAGKSEAVSSVHNKHFDKSKGCKECHDVIDSPTWTFNAVRGPLPHVILPDYTGAGNDGTLLQGRANAAQDAATVTRASMTFDDGFNTCANGIGLSCHASGTPDWDITIPATSAGCVMCHTETNSAAFNPTSGLHDNSPSGPTVTGNAHDGSFDDGNSGTADCTTCHSTSPTIVAANHINGTLNAGTAITLQAIAGYTQANGTCATTCHSAGTVWAYKWSTSAYATNGTECGNCHGDYTNGWNTGVAPHTENPTRGNRHNNTGTLTYPCTDCHVIGSVSGYNWTSKWDPAGVTSNHGDNKITMNQTAVNTFVIDTVPNPDRAGCTTSSCHTNDAAHTLRITTTALPTQTVSGNQPSILCSSCHGGYAGTNANGYWPDGANVVDNGVEDNSGAHQKHITALAKSKYNETLAQLLTNNGNGTADAKQKFLCAYCHTNPGADGDHGILANLPAEVNTMYSLWDLTQATPDNGLFTPASGTCATVDCHNNKTTPTVPTSYVWYSGSTSACLMCHLDVTAEAKHTAHTGSAANFGRAITCDDCHKTAAENVAWGAPGTPPTNNHMNGALTVTGSVAFTYASNSCGTNACHNAGDGVTAPLTTPYPWNGGALANCTICHAGTPATGAHVKHVGNTAYVSGSCGDCHNNSTASQITAATHLNGTKNTGGAKSVVFNANGSCTNTCHLSAEVGDWTGGSAAIACVDCHSGSGVSAYIGGDKTSVPGPNYLPQYNMHVLTPTVSGKKHDGTLTACITCHTSISAQATHINGVWTADDADNTNDQHRGLFATYTDALNGGSCSGAGVACHADGGSWTRKWKSTVAATNGSECANCHGDFTSGWNAGVGHAVNPTRGNTSTHNDSGPVLGYQCTACHVLGSTTPNYPWTSLSNDWKATDALATTLHGDGKLTINSNGTTHARNESPVGTWKSGCKGCHDGPSNDGLGADDANHDFPVNIANAPSTVRWQLLSVAGDTAAAAGGCDGCHNSGTAGQFWPGHLSVYPSRGGKHLEHVKAIALSYFGADTTANRNNSCDFCHLNPGEAGHNDNVEPADVTPFKNIKTAAIDANGVRNRLASNKVTCSTVDCHFNNAITPHWYADTFPPAAVSLTAATSVTRPNAIKVTWLAPGDDDNVAETTPYKYDMRYGTTSIIAADFASTTNYVGNIPAAYKQGYSQEVEVENLAPGTTYYFTLRTQDTAGNWSTASTVTSATASSDTKKPVFGGANYAVAGDETTTINLHWSSAEDHTMPITYKIWMKAESAGALDMSVDAPLLTGLTDNHYQLTAANGVVNDTVYHLGVRACDSATVPNCDINTQTVSATPTAEPLVPKTFATYRTSGSLTLVKNGTTGTAVTLQALPQIFASANVSKATTVYADTFTVYVAAGNGGSTIRATLGYSTNGTNFTSLGVTKDVAMGTRAKRVVSFKLVDVAGKNLAIGQGIAVQISLVSGAATTISYGDSVNRGDLTVAERMVNTVPSDPVLNATVSGGLVSMTWTQAIDTVDGVTDTVHYDLYGSNDNGSTYKYLLATDLPATTTAYSWNTQESGILSATAAVRLKAGDGYGHFVSSKTALAVNNSADNVAPNAITDLVSHKRPKAGSVYLTWTAPGDDEENHGRAKFYDIRYSTAAITEGNWAAATQAVAEPTPDFGGEVQHYEVTGLTPLTPYYFAIKTVDDGGKISPISTPKSAGSDQEEGGPHCGMCHTTAPSVVESVGNHKLHGYTVNDCTRCHGAAVASYGLDHQDGVLTMGYGDGGVHPAIISGNRIYYTDNGLAGGTVLYDDPDGGGGFGTGNYANIGDGVDDGTCFNFGTRSAGSCHGPSGSDLDGTGTTPSLKPAYISPSWTATANLDCANCHGVPGRTTDTFYGRAFDGTTANAGIVPDQIKGAPPIDNHDNASGGATEAERKYIGQHEKHLNYSFRFSKGDSCNLCHEGKYAVKSDLDGKHANGEVNVKLDLVAAGANAIWTPGTATTAGTCSNMSPNSCHPSTATPKWDSSVTFDCVQCHTMGGTVPSHVTDPNGAGFVSDGKGNCTWCHFGGHPRDDVAGTALILANSSQVGINYRSGGIHLKKTIGGRATQTTEAQICWTCHDANSISEWGADTGANNTSTAPPNASDYNYGTVTTSNWTTATWSSPVANFSYKNGAIQSTHSTSESGTSTVSGAMGTYTETKDAVGNIRCSNCHDVHNLNKAPNDSMTGQPYLRGTWIRNPYPEDGAPWNKTYAVAVANYGAVPRGGGNEQGGYQIDQNNNSPTAGLSLATSAGLCTLCHGTNVDALDKKTSENLWIGTNGHSNATLGGTGGSAANIFGDGIGGRAAPNAAASDSTYAAGDIFNMGLQVLAGGTAYGTGYRGTVYGPKYLPAVPSKVHSYDSFIWGVSVDAGTTDIGYHAFTCSKCHNPHASRLPKLMITNCLDVKHNTWGAGKGSLQNTWTAAALTDKGKYTQYHNTAQNCHRYDGANGGWNKVTPW